MKPPSPIYKLKGVIRHYDWGGYQFLPTLLSLPNEGKKPMAEYWLGAHDSASAELITGGQNIFLDQFISSDPVSILGKTVSKKYRALPYLFKILDVRDMLSIQVHPSKYEAEKEFAKENAENIPLNSPRRNYKDDNHKPELIAALGDFWLLHGFKPVEELHEVFEKNPGFHSLREIFDQAGYDQLYKTVMEMPQESVDDLLQPLLKRILPLYQNNKLDKSQEDFWAARAALTFNKKGKADRGIFSIYFLNLVNLKQGQGIFQDAGILHAYLEGQTAEIMANSDNVLRGGLTNKHVDVKELMRHIKFEETSPLIIRAKPAGNREMVYHTGAPDFILSRFVFRQDENHSYETATAEIIFVVNGQVSLSSANAEVNLSKGEAAFIISHQRVSLKAAGNAELFRATVPVHTGE